MVLSMVLKLHPYTLENGAVHGAEATIDYTVGQCALGTLLCALCVYVCVKMTK